MRATVDTNVLVRTAVKDDLAQTQIAMKVMADASLIAIGLATLCEFVWVLRGRYKIVHADIATAIRALTESHKVELNRSAVEAGLAMLDAGGDFADGIIAYEGSWLGGETFVSFDKKALKLLADRGLSTKLLR